jgi:hypothetical protein
MIAQAWNSSFLYSQANWYVSSIPVITGNQYQVQFVSSHHLTWPDVLFLLLFLATQHVKKQQQDNVVCHFPTFCPLTFFRETIRSKH